MDKSLPLSGPGFSLICARAELLTLRLVVGNGDSMFILLLRKEKPDDLPKVT